MQVQNNKKRLNNIIAIGIIIVLIIVISVITVATVLALSKRSDSNQTSKHLLPHTLPSDSQPKSNPLNVTSRAYEEKLLKRVRNGERTAELHNLSKFIDNFIHENHRLPNIQELDYQPDRPLEITDTGQPYTDVIVYTKNIDCDGTPLDAGYSLTTFVENTDNDRIEERCRDGGVG